MAKSGAMEFRVGCDDGGDLGEQLAAEDLALRGEPAALVVGQPESLAAKLLLEYAVLFDEVIDDLGLAVVGLAGEGGEEQLEVNQLGHCGRFRTAS